MQGLRNSGTPFQIEDPKLVEVSDKMLTVNELARRLRVAPSWVYGHADRLGAYRLGKYLRFDWQRVLARILAGEISESSLGSQPNDPLQGQ